MQARVKSPSPSPRDGSPSSLLDQGQVGTGGTRKQGGDPVSKPEEGGSGATTAPNLQAPATQPKSPLATSTPAKAAGKSQVKKIDINSRAKIVSI